MSDTSLLGGVTVRRDLAPTDPPAFDGARSDAEHFPEGSLGGRPRAAMTIDVEDYYHAHALLPGFPRAAWPGLERRVEANTHALLDQFSEMGVLATFFTLGSVAREFPSIPKRIVAEGHELASHGWAHHAVHDQSRAEFLEDVSRARDVLQDIGGTDVRGYRAPSFSIGARTPWAYEALAQAGYRYSSSSNPIAHDHYGDAAAPRFAFVEQSSGIREIPVTTLEVMGRRLPAGGGGFFRVLPSQIFTQALHQVSRAGEIGNFYLHPWEIDPGQPRAQAVPVKSRLRHYAGLSRCQAKLGRHLCAANWGRMDALYGLI